MNSEETVLSNPILRALWIGFTLFAQVVGLIVVGLIGILIGTAFASLLS